MEQVLKYYNRFKYVMGYYHDGAGPAELRHSRRDRKEAYGYTDEEALFCDMFDTAAARWEAAQLALASEDARRCEICCELKPSWMTTVALVHGGDTLYKGLKWSLPPPPKPPNAEDASAQERWEQAMEEWTQQKQKWEAYVTNSCVGHHLCTRCREPTDAEKMACTHRFGKANQALLHKLPPPFPLEELETQLAKDEFAIFSIATEAEIALVRLTIPWCALHTSPPLASRLLLQPKALITDRSCASAASAHPPSQHQAQDAQMRRHAEQGALRLRPQQADHAA